MRRAIFAHWSRDGIVRWMFMLDINDRNLLSSFIISIIWLEMKKTNSYHAMDKFSRRQIDDTFLIFPQKIGLTFRANCLPRRQFV